MLELPHGLSQRRVILLLDALSLVWVALWIGLGYLIYEQVLGLGSLSNTVILAGKAIRATADALGGIASIPFVGGRVSGLADSARQAADSAIYNGRASRSDVHELAILLWVTLALAPTTPLLVLYGLLRRGWRRDVRSLALLVDGLEDDESLQRFLARRALEHLPYWKLRGISENPWRDVEEGRTEQLAHAELERIGLRREPGR